MATVNRRQESKDALKKAEDLNGVFRSRLKYMKDAISQERERYRELNLKYEKLLDVQRDLNNLREEQNEILSADAGCDGGDDAGVRPGDTGPGTEQRQSEDGP